MHLTHEEAQAVLVLRKAMRNKPEIIAALLDNQGQAVAAKALLQVRDELDCMLRVSRAFQAACKSLIEAEKGKE